MASDLKDVTLTSTLSIEWYSSSGVCNKNLKFNKGTLALYRNEFRELFLFVSSAKSGVNKFPLKAVSVHKKFMHEGKACIKFSELNLSIFISNAPAAQLALFLKVLYIKLASCKQSPKTTVRNKLLSVKSESFEDISPLNAKDLSRTKSELDKRNVSKKRLAYPIDIKKEVPAKRICLKSVISLTEEQKTIVDAVLRGSNVFFTGGAGTGKTFLLRSIINSLPPDQCVATASTGSAACLIGGITLHSFAGIGSGEMGMEGCMKLASRPSTMQNWRKCKHLIIDEISMIDGAYFEKIDAVARSIRGNPDKPFGGVQLIVCGDFFQLPPVSNTPKKNFCFSSMSWDLCRFSYYSLKQVHRQADPQFVSLLNSVRVGIVTSDILDTLKQTSSQDIESDGVLATRLCSHTKDAVAINQSKLSSLQGEARVYEATDNPYTSSKMLDDCTPARKEIVLKVGAQVMLLKNLSISKGLVNGARGIVDSFSANGDPVVKFMCGERCTLKNESWTIKGPNGVTYTRKQIPLRLAWAFSIHKSQGLTLDCVEMNLQKIFEAGQAYVALSRARSLKSLRVIGFNEKQVWADPEVIQFYRKLKSYEQEFIPLGRKK